MMYYIILITFKLWILITIKISFKKSNLQAQTVFLTLSRKIDQFTLILKLITVITNYWFGWMYKCGICCMFREKKQKLCCVGT